MRLQARLKLGYYPLSAEEARRIAGLLQFSSSSTSVLDPCAGTGAALAMITQAKEVRRYAIELDACRAADAKANADEVIQGNAFDCHAPVESFSLLYLNPPYDFEIGEGKNERMETVFLEHFFRWLKPGGVLVMVIPFDRVYECRRVLTPHFRHKAIYRLTAPESIAYKQGQAFQQLLRVAAFHFKVKSLGNLLFASVLTPNTATRTILPRFCYGSKAGGPDFKVLCKRLLREAEPIIVNNLQFASFDWRFGTRKIFSDLFVPAFQASVLLDARGSSISRIEGQSRHVK